MFIGYLIATDDSVSYAVVLVSKIVKFQYEKIKWWTLHNPANPLVKHIMYRKSMRMAEELMREFAEKENK
jgi:hypothetical protein